MRKTNGWGIRLLASAEDFMSRFRDLFGCIPIYGVAEMRHV
jgi:hypothetical protein